LRIIARIKSEKNKGINQTYKASSAPRGEIMPRRGLAGKIAAWLQHARAAKDGRENVSKSTNM